MSTSGNSVFLTIQEIEELQFPPQEFIWGPISEKSLGLVVGQAKIGKTRTVENLCYDIAAGRDQFLGIEIKKPELKICLALIEESIRKRRDRHLELLATYTDLEKQKIQQNLRIIGEFPSYLSTSSLRERFKKEVKDAEPDILVIDSMSHLTDKNISETETAKQVMKWLQELTSDLNITTIVIHHVTKLYETSFPTMDNIKGTTEIVQESDYAIGVGKVNDKRAIKSIFSRYSAEEEGYTKYNIGPNGRFELLGVSTERELIRESDGRYDETRRNEFESVFNNLVEESSDGTVRTKELITGMDVDPRRTHELIANFLEEGKITRVSKGKYKLIAA